MKKDTGVSLAIFDLDNTLIAGDSDHAWSEFLINKGLVERDDVKDKNDAFYQQYQDGNLDIQAYLRFALSFVAGKTPETLAPLHQAFMDEAIEPLLLPKATALLDKHRAQGDTLLIITATNRFVTEPIAKRLGVEHLIACDVEIKDGLYTGEPTGLPSFQQGKVTRLQEWLEQHEETLEGAWFYSDSHNDLPLLKTVDHPVAVNPDNTLLAHAQKNDWPVLDLRSNG